MPTVHILATCRKPELAPYTALVFKTLRVGFPTFEIKVHINGDCETNLPEIRELAHSVGGEWVNENTIHHEWIEDLLNNETEPFYILDTDVIFYQNFELFHFSSAIAGARIPEWRDEFTNTITKPRLHGSLLYIDPIKVKKEIADYESQFPKTPFNPLINLFYPIVIPSNGEGIFYDTCGLLYHAIGGEAFTPEQLDCYFHFNFGSISDIVLPHLKEAVPMQVAREAILQNPQLGKGLWRKQMEYYDSLKVAQAPISIPKVNPEDAAKAVQWNWEMCKGDKEAMSFNDLWYHYVHGIDDLIDTMEDGKPAMSQEQIIALFINAAMLYNCPFFVRHRDLLFPTVILVTNSYADSVAWEKSSINRRRVMADCLRCCGDEMYYMVAMIKGGWEAMRKYSPVIRERDWIGQHDEKDNPN